ncbi:MAG: response regulator [Candidatus Omnitrophica bacterium]|jgi:DNA-binding response OmpR family regulator|nr:response regulator [Candidatus Omnitrophota bacterium]
MSKILIADDEKEISEMIGTSLRRSGYEVFSALDGKTAIETAKCENPDVILLDLRFPKPGLDGIEILTAIREFNKEVKVILTSGLGAEAKEIEQAQGLGISKFLPKPLDIAQLKETLREMVGNNTA